MIEIKMGGFCKECMVLQARAEITDKNGKRLSLSDQIYTHHIVVVTSGRSLNMAPIMSTDLSSFSCAAGKAWEALFGATPNTQGSKPSSSDHGSHSKRSPQLGGSFGASPSGGLGARGLFDIFIAKGNEGDSSIFATQNTSSPIKSGYWVGKSDPILGVAEIISYKPVPQEVYLTVDYHYIPMNGPKPADYLDAGFGTIMTQQCGDINLRKFIVESCGDTN
jgi:hypothetical protein